MKTWELQILIVDGNDIRLLKFGNIPNKLAFT